jgi:starch synthase
MNRRRLGVVAHTRFHMFDLAREMARRSWYVHLCTATPRHLIDSATANELHVRLGWATWEQALDRMNRFGVRVPTRWSNEMGRLGRRQLSTWACRYLQDCDIVDALSGWGLECGRFVQEHGGRYVCNRGSTHILFQRAIVEEEYARWGAGALEGCPQWGVERELAEYELADAVVVPSQFAQETFVAHGVAERKVFRCPYGVDLSLFSPQPRRDDVFRVLFVGAASVQKGIGYLLDAMRPLVERRHAELWLVGAVSAEARGILDRNADILVHKGFVRHHDLAQIYGQGSVLVLPSIQDGFGRVLVEAMACGLPIIGTTHSGAGDLVEDGKEGFIVPIRDPAAIRSRLDWMLANPTARRTMGQMALARVQSLGGWADYAAAVERMYRQLMGDSASRIRPAAQDPGYLRRAANGASPVAP